MLERGKETLSGFAGQEVVAAVSGGMDSMCLLHLVHTFGRSLGIRVTAAHFNHQLRGAESDRDEAFVRDWCREHDIPFVCGRGDVKRLAQEQGLSVEEAARELRYAFLREAAAGRPVLTAHHADDNAETMLLNLLRGTGLKGLTGIPAERQGIARPFLEIPRTELAEYAAAEGVRYAEDSTNALEDAARNVLRHRVLPVLKELNPRAVENMTRTASLLAQDEAALARAAEELLLNSCCATECGFVLPLADCQQADRAVLSRCVLELLTRVGGHRKDISAAHVEAVCGLPDGAAGREVHLPYGVTARSDGRQLLIFRRAETPEPVSAAMGETVSFGGWQVRLSTVEGTLELSVPTGAVLTVTPWNRDDGMTLPGSRGRRSLKRLCADAGLTPEQRDCIPVLRVGGRCASVPGIGMDTDFTAGSHPETVFVTFYKETHFKETEENHHGA